MTLCLAASIVFANIVLPVGAQSPSVAPADKPSPWSAEEGFVIYQDKDKTACRDATTEEALTMPGRDTDIQLRRLNHPELELEGAAARAVKSGGAEQQTANVEAQGLRILLEGTEQLNANPTAAAAFRRAAAAWEAVIATPVVVRLKVDYGTTRFGRPWEPGSRTLGETGSSTYRVSYSRLRQSLLNGASSAAESDLYQRLPTTTVPTNLGAVSEMSVSSSLAQTFGIVADVPDANLPSIAFNSNYGFDFNPDDGIEPGKTDFHSVAVHEIGHALGFNSRAGVTEMPNYNTSEPLRLSVWDLFRFLPGTTLDAFTAAPRRMSSGETHVHYAGGAELQLSTGRPDGNGGDGRQSSHWKDDALGSSAYVGIMDPTIRSGTAYLITQNDLAALDAFGYRLTGQAAPPPPPAPGNNDFAAARAIGGNSGTVSGTNAYATLEAGEPNHGGVPNGASVWYVWQAPASGAATFTTAGSDYDTTLGIYTGGGVAALSGIGGNDDVSPNDTTSIVAFNAVAGRVYRIAVDGYAGETGSLSLNWSLAVATPEYVATALSSNQVELKTWQTGGRTEAYVKLTFPTNGYRVASWGSVTALPGNRFGVEARVERSTAGAAQIDNSTANIYNFGALTPGVTYAFDFRTSGSPAASLDFSVNTASGSNPIDVSRRFVQEHYVDFLGRQPDAPGWDFWTNQIMQCGTDAACLDRQRVAVSGSFFLSDEFQVTGYYVYRLYKGALGRRPRYREFLAGQAAVAAGIVVGDRLSPVVIDANKLAFARSFVQTPEFLARYPVGISEYDFIDGVFLTATGAMPKAEERTALQISYVNTAGTLADKRAYVLARILDGIRTVPRGVGVEQIFETPSGQAFYAREYNPAFVQMQYFGYLRRDEDESGYQFWLAKLNQFGNYRDAEMVRSFILAAEYRARYGQP